MIKVQSENGTSGVIQIKRANKKLFADVQQRLGTQYKVGKAQEGTFFKEINEEILKTLHPDRLYKTIDRWKSIDFNEFVNNKYPFDFIS